MIETLKENKELNLHREWFSNGIKIINNTLSGSFEPIEISKKAISVLSEYLECAKGTICIYNKEDNILELKSTYAYNERDMLSNRFKMGEGSIGQAALEMKPILIKNILQQDKLINTSMLQVAPINIYTVPLIYENELYGVLELLKTQEFSETDKEFLSEASGVIATYLYSSLKNSKHRMQ